MRNSNVLGLFILLICLAYGQSENVPSAIDQCRIYLNDALATFCQDDLSNICTSLSCRRQQTNECAKQDVGAANGTVCGPGKKCLNDACVINDDDEQRVLDDCPYGDSVVDDEGTTCEDYVIKLIEKNESPFVKCQDVSFRQKCCQTCKIYDNLKCENPEINDDPASCTFEPLKCSPYLCQNGATCIDRSEPGANKLIEFECQCKDGYFGSYCELKNPCEPNPCQNEGVCSRQGSVDFKCECKNDFSGPTCTERSANRVARQYYYFNYNPCTSHPCANNGQCVQYSDIYYCICLKGYVGTRCEIVNACAINPCQYNGWCIATNIWPNYYRCQCDPRYYGNNCQFPAPTTVTVSTASTASTTVSLGVGCASRPCLNGGTCRDNFIWPYYYTCTCATNYYGHNCQYLSSPCTDILAGCLSMYCNIFATTSPNPCRKTCGFC